MGATFPPLEMSTQKISPQEEATLETHTGGGQTLNHRGTKPSNFQISPLKVRHSQEVRIHIMRI